MTADGYALFPTPIGTCGLAWNARGLVRTILPEPSIDTARARLQHRLPGTAESDPPDDMRLAMTEIARLLHGEPADLGWVPLDDSSVSELDRRVYAIARTIAAGATLTYGDIARRLGDVALARRVGEALGRNPFPIVVPCHRVLAAGGRTGGFSAPGKADTKMRLLRIEGAVLL